MAAACCKGTPAMWAASFSTCSSSARNDVTLIGPDLVLVPAFSLPLVLLPGFTGIHTTWQTRCRQRRSVTRGSRLALILTKSDGGAGQEWGQAALPAFPLLRNSGVITLGPRGCATIAESRPPLAVPHSVGCDVKE